MFKIGDKAVYPAHGVGEVTSIEKRKVGAKDVDFYVLRILENGMKVLIPTTNIKNVGLRGVITRKEADRVIGILKNKKTLAPPDHQTWNRRYREYMEKIKTGSVFEVAEVLRDLYSLKYGKEKELSFGERRMLEMARSLVVKELAIAQKKKEGEIEKELEKIFNV